MSRSRRLVLAAVVLGSCIGCDVVSKTVATSQLREGARHELLAGVVQLAYAENAGAFLGLGDSLGPLARPLVFVLGVSVLLGLLAWYLARSGRLKTPQVLGLALILGGGVANLIDRVAHGFVRDFVQLRFGPVATGIFNVADLAITSGAVALVLHWLLRASVKRRTE